MPKKVLFIITKSNWGGAQRYVFDVATNLHPLDFQSIVAFGGNGELSYALSAAGIKTVPITSLGRDVRVSHELRAIIEIFKLVRREKPDVLHINSSKAGLYGALIGRICRVPRIVFTAHGWAFNEPRPSWQRFVFKTLHWLTVLLSHQTIAVSETLKNQLRWPGTPSRISVVRLGRSVPVFKSREDARQLLEMQVTNTAYGLVDFHTDTWIGTIAELHPIKNLSVAIDAVASLVHALPKLRYIIIGEGQERAHLENQIHHLGLEEYVFLVGSLPEAARFMKAFDLFVLPSQSEGAGYVLLEAGLAEVPIVATNVGGIPELISDQETGRLVPPGAVDALTAAIRELLADPARQQEYTAALSRICTEFSVTRMVDETVRVYRDGTQ